MEYGKQALNGEPNQEIMVDSRIGLTELELCLV